MIMEHRNGVTISDHVIQGACHSVVVVVGVDAAPPANHVSLCVDGSF